MLTTCTYAPPSTSPNQIGIVIGDFTRDGKNCFSKNLSFVGSPFEYSQNRTSVIWPSGRYSIGTNWVSCGTARLVPSPNTCLIGCLPDRLYSPLKARESRGPARQDALPFFHVCRATFVLPGAKIIMPFFISASMVSESPGTTSPSSSFMASGSWMSRWMARLSGRAPNCGS